MRLSTSSHRPIILFCLAIPLVSSCLRTANNAPGDFIPVPRAKTFTSAPTTVSTVTPQEESNESWEESTTTSTSTTTASTAKPSTDPYYERKYQVKTFASRTEAGGETRLLRRNESESSGGVSFKKSGTTEPKPQSVFPIKEKPVGMCKKCADITMTSVEELKKRCDNWKEIEDNFYMNMETDKPLVKETYTDSECFKTIKCKEPHAIVRWLDYSMCDVHNSSNDRPEFELKCNGTAWTMHGFPIDAVTCARKIRHE